MLNIMFKHQYHSNLQYLTCTAGRLSLARRGCSAVQVECGASAAPRHRRPSARTHTLVATLPPRSTQRFSRDDITDTHSSPWLVGLIQHFE